MLLRSFRLYGKKCNIGVLKKSILMSAFLDIAALASDVYIMVTNEITLSHDYILQQWISMII